MDQSVKPAVKPLWRKRKHLAIAMRKVLHERFPLAFMGFTLQKQPLKIGIHADIMKAAPDLPKKEVRYAIQNYVKGRTYHRAASIPGTVRVDLAGHACGVVTVQDAKFHVERLQKIDQYMKRQRQAKEAKEAQKNAISNS